MQKWLEYYLLTATERGVRHAAFAEASRYMTASCNAGGVGVDHSGRISKSVTQNTENLQGSNFRVDIEVWKGIAFV